MINSRFSRRSEWVEHVVGYPVCLPPTRSISKMDYLFGNYNCSRVFGFSCGTTFQSPMGNTSVYPLVIINAPLLSETFDCSVLVGKQKEHLFISLVAFSQFRSYLRALSIVRLKFRTRRSLRNTLVSRQSNPK
jgi:hypothetical protein